MIVVTYLYVTLILGPKLMANRKPFKLREILIYYNGAQVLFSSIMLYEVNWFVHFLYRYLFENVLLTKVRNVAILTHTDVINFNHNPQMLIIIEISIIVDNYFSCVVYE